MDDPSLDTNAGESLRYFLKVHPDSWSFTLAFYHSMHLRKGRTNSYKTTCTCSADSHRHMCLLPSL